MLSPAELSRLATVLGGLPVSRCQRSSPAGLAGVRYGDIMLSINDLPIASWSDFFAAHARCEGALTVHVWRRGVEFDAGMHLPAGSRSPREVLEAPQRREPIPYATEYC